MTELDREAIEHAASTAAKTAVVGILKVLGIDASQPFEVQADMRFVRTRRLRAESMVNRGIMAGVASIVTAALAYLYSIIPHK